MFGCVFTSVYIVHEFVYKNTLHIFVYEYQRLFLLVVCKSSKLVGKKIVVDKICATLNIVPFQVGIWWSVITTWL